METAIILGVIWFTVVYAHHAVVGREYRAQQRYQRCLKNIYDMETRMFVGKSSYDFDHHRELPVGDPLPYQLRWVTRKLNIDGKTYTYTSW